MSGVRELWVNLPIGGPTEENRVQDVRGIQGRKARAIHLYGCLLYTSPSPRDRG